MDTIWKPRCEACKKVCREYKRCTGCFSVNYCSTDCQRSHWSVHKKKCTGKSDKTPWSHSADKNLQQLNRSQSTVAGSRGSSNKQETTKPVWRAKCEACKKFCEDLKRCTGCYKVYYCSTECQKSHWKIHKKHCTAGTGRSKKSESDPSKQSKDEETELSGGTRDQSKQTGLGASFSTENEENQKQKIVDGTNGAGSSGSPTTTELCKTCGKQGKLRNCAACKRVSYCSRTCQTKDWKNHKPNCDKIDGFIKTEGVKKDEREEFLRQRRETPQVPPFLNPFMNPFELMMMNMMMERTEAQRPSGSLSIAKKAARRRYPFSEIVDDLGDVPHEWGFHGMFRRSSVFVAFMFKLHEHIMRHGVYIKDKDDEVTHVLFYIDFDTPLPYFRWADIRPGRYICLQNPRIHNFMDGTVGIRMEEPSDVSFIDV